MQTPSAQLPQPATAPGFLQSSNFWTAVVMAVGGLFVGFPEGLGEQFVAELFALLGTGKLLREYIKSRPAVNAGEAVNRSNWWNYIGVIITSIVPMIPGEFIDSLQNVLSNLLSSNWQGVLVALFSIATILYNLFQSKNKEPETGNA
jgi:hypothetical protein